MSRCGCEAPPGLTRSSRCATTEAACLRYGTKRTTCGVSASRGRPALAAGRTAIMALQRWRRAPDEADIDRAPCARRAARRQEIGRTGATRPVSPRRPSAWPPPRSQSTDRFERRHAVLDHRSSSGAEAAMGVEGVPSRPRPRCTHRPWQRAGSSRWCRSRRRTSAPLKSGMPAAGHGDGGGRRQHRLRNTPCASWTR